LGRNPKIIKAEIYRGLGFPGVKRLTNRLNKAKHLYRLNRQGIDLLPVLVESILWSDKYLQTLAQSKKFAKQLRKNKEGLLNKSPSPH
jgi:hypothetical protein